MSNIHVDQKATEVQKSRGNKYTYSQCLRMVWMNSCSVLGFCRRDASCWLLSRNSRPIIRKPTTANKSLPRLIIKVIKSFYNTCGFVIQCEILNGSLNTQYVTKDYLLLELYLHKAKKKKKVKKRLQIRFCASCEH